MTITRPAPTTALLYAIVVAGAVVLTGCETAQESTAAVAPPDPAALVVDRLIEAFNAEDIEGVAGVFGDDVPYVFHDTAEELVGAGAAAFFQGYFGRETGERITEPFHAPDGRTYFLSTWEDSYGSSTTVVFDLEMDGERLVSMGDRSRKFEEVFAAGEVDALYAAFNDHDADRLTDELEGVTYTSPAGVELTGADVAKHWTEAFGVVVARTTGVFDIGGGALGFVVEHRERDSGRSTPYAVEIERTDGRITSMTERPLRS